MNILEYGSIIMCRNITFEDNKYDIEGRHPGIVLLPTNENEDDVYCLYMTSDKKRAKEESYKYLKFKGISKKDSYINIQQIIKRENIKEKIYDKIEDTDFIKLLETFYNYQLELEPKSENFNQIEEKIRILLEILKRKENLNIETDDISQDELEILESIGDMNKEMMIYGTKLLSDYEDRKKVSSKIETEFLKGQKERNYAQKILNVYQKIKRIDANKLNSNDLYKILEEIYFSEKSNVHLININVLFEDLNELLKLKKSNVNLIGNIEKVIEIQKKKEEQINAEERTKMLEKQAKKEQKKQQDQIEAKDNIRKNKLFDKYGKFDIDYFDGK